MRTPGATAAAGLTAHLAGQLHLRPGAARGLALRSTRPRGLVRRLRGQPAAALPGLLAALFSACGGVHRLGADLALACAATGQPQQPDAAQRRLLQWHTLRSHLQALALDWPRLLTAPQADGSTHPAALQAGLALLADSPLHRAAPGQPDGAALAALPAWLAARVFHQPLADWLAAWQADPADAFQRWARRHADDGPVARWLLDAQPVASKALPRLRALHPHADAAGLRALLDQARDVAADASAPRWQGRCADTGPGTRLAASHAALPSASSAWLRLGARLADLARLALPDADRPSGADTLPTGSHLLSLGAAPLNTGAAVAWLETSRGLLLQAFWLQPGPPGAAPVLGDALVIAPTDWTADPDGAWARALEALPSDAPAAAVQALVAAYDPCVPCVIDTAPDRAAAVPAASPEAADA